MATTISPLSTSPLLAQLSELSPLGASQTTAAPGSQDTNSSINQELSALLQLVQLLEQMLGSQQPGTPGQINPGGPIQPAGGTPGGPGGVAQPPPGGGTPGGPGGVAQPPPGGGTPGGPGDVAQPPPGSGTPPPISGAQVFNNLQDSPWKSNTNDGQIAGSGKGLNGNPLSMKITPGQTMDYSSQAGAYANTLGSQDIKVSPNDTHFQTNYDIDPSASTMKNMQASENDLIVTNKNGQHAVFGTQFNYAEKAPKGETWFQTWDTQSGKWENAALVPTPKAGQNNSVSLTDTMNANGTYSYSPLQYDGKTYQLANNTFNDTTSNWTRNEAVWQVQEDANAKGGPLDTEYTDMQLQAWA